MAHFKKFPQEKKEGKIIYDNVIVDNIVMLAVSEVPFVELFHYNPRTLKSKSVCVSFDKKGVNIEVGILIHFSQRVSEIVFKVQEIIRHNLETMTEYKISSVDVIVKGVKFDEIKPEPKQVDNSNEVSDSQKTEDAGFNS